MKYHFRIHKEGKGFWAESLEPGLGVNSQGDTLAELRANIQAGLDLALDEPEDADWSPPPPDRRLARLSRAQLERRGIVAVAPSPAIAFAASLRAARKKRRLTQKQLAKLLGMANFQAYQKLEDGSKANPELKTLAKLKQVLPELSLDEVLV